MADLTPAAIRRLTPAERKAAARYARNLEGVGHPGRRWGGDITPPEPALGTLDERLDIIIRRLGGRVGPIRLTPGERALVQSYQEAA